MKALYKRPSVRFESLHLRENIADKCWAYANKDNPPPFYYDTPGPGYVQFRLTGHSCGQTALEFVKKVPENNPADISAILDQGNSGEPVKGIFSTIRPS